MLQRSILIMLVLLSSVAIHAQDVIPDVEIPDFNNITADNGFDLATQLTDVLNQIQSLPDDIFGSSGMNSETATQFFGYAKWMFSTNGANELLGQTLAPIAINLYLVLGITIFLTIAWATIRIALLVFRFVYFIVREILRVLPFFG